MRQIRWFPYVLRSVFERQQQLINAVKRQRNLGLPCYLQGSENGRVVTIGKHSRLNRQIWYRHPNSEAGNDEIQNVNMDFYFVGITF